MQVGETIQSLSAHTVIFFVHYRLIAKHGGVRSLLTVCVDPSLRRMRVGAFRALGTVCCVLEAIMELEEAGGVQVRRGGKRANEEIFFFMLVGDLLWQILSDTLRDDDSTEDEKSEAAGLLAQVRLTGVANLVRFLKLK